ncbi:PE-PPE domain-containing protein [Mycolicibacter sp. MYC123]|uniref:PE-PPE domain-containing protein n=1 Tax=[Mycobacterium] zoologicum TaxID=2872311 RepID=A0ABU5YKQ0_9MYCO|nr:MULTISPECIES: PE-PPE domain-containing protein [unclassified Mycolicibacter]MEB3050475.1 PE-PPE domain-containing protein [Mycolicibacter sp. MYC123]MEB3064053.1 PE-PPE domain-containing protein [Mycolicibacter sp. MYC101]
MKSWGSTAQKSIASFAVAGVVMAGVGISPPAHAAALLDAALLATTGPLAGSQTALILGGTTEPRPSPDFARTAENLFLNPLGFNGGSTGSTVCYMDGTDPCSAPLQVLTTPELIQQGPSSLTAASAIVLAVENEFAANPGAYDAEHPLVIFGYSQSATAESIAMTRLAEAGIPTDALHFVFIGDPSTPDGIWGHIQAAMDATLGTDLTNWLLTTFGMTEVLGSQTPTDLYSATIYGLPNDPVANFVDVYADKGLWGALLDIFWPHVWYLGLTPEQVADATTSVDGALTYVNINDDDINGLDAWLSAVFSGGAANSGLFDSVSDSLQLLFSNFF